VASAELCKAEKVMRSRREGMSVGEDCAWSMEKHESVDSK